MARQTGSPSSARMIFTLSSLPRLPTCCLGQQATHSDCDPDPSDKVSPSATPAQPEHGDSQRRRQLVRESILTLPFIPNLVCPGPPCCPFLLSSYCGHFCSDSSKTQVPFYPLMSMAPPLFSTTRRSVTTASMRSAGVTSNAGLI